MHERLVNTYDVVTDRASRGFHVPPLSLTMTHSKWSIGHAFRGGIRGFYGSRPPGNPDVYAQAAS